MISKMQKMLLMLFLLFSVLPNDKTTNDFNASTLFIHFATNSQKTIQV